MVFRRKLCFGLLLVLFTIFTASCVGFSDVNAYTADYGVRVVVDNNGECLTDNYTTGHSFNQNFYGCGVRTIVPISGVITPTGNTVVISGKINLVKEMNRDYSNFFNRYPEIYVSGVGFNGQSLTITQNPQINFWITQWTNNYNGVDIKMETLTIQYSVIAMGNIKDISSRLQVAFHANTTSDTFDRYGNYVPSRFYFESTDLDMSYIFIDSGGNSDSTIINQNDTMISQNQTIINQNQQYYNKENQAENNISNQSAGDIQGAENQQTTSLIGVISSFIGALSNINTGSCDLTLPFPEFVGGSKTVTPCNGKQIAPTMVQVVSSLLLIIVFVPLAFIVLRMIYNEIRSWTNG